MTELREKLNNIVEEKNTKIIPENIKNGVSIFGVVGNMPEPENPTKYITKCNGLFYSDNNLKEITNFDCSSATSLYQMFYSCYYIEKIELKNVLVAYTAQNMCGGCSELKEFTINNIQSTISFSEAFVGCSLLEKLSIPDGTKVDSISGAFRGCKKLVDIPMFDTSPCKNFDYAFDSCQSLSDESLNKILLMCANATSYPSTKTKTLAQISLTADQATRCQSLSNYQAFLNAGWTTGY